jgi:CheY-like chemotaxis protein
MYKILVVDDHAELAELIAKLLEIRGYETDVAADGVRALQLAEAHRIGLVILDWRLSDGPSGVGLVERLRERCGPVPVVIVSADAQSLAEASRAAVSDYLPKPFLAVELLRVIDEWGHLVSPPSA